MKVVRVSVIQGVLLILEIFTAIIEHSEAYSVNSSIGSLIVIRSGLVTLEELLRCCLKKHRFTKCLLGPDNEDIMDSCHFSAYLMTSCGHRPHRSFDFQSKNSWFGNVASWKFELLIDYLKVFSFRKYNY